jgi:lipoyl(octanoyl) transferase
VTASFGPTLVNDSTTDRAAATGEDRTELKVHRIGRIGYENALALQEELVQRKLEDEADDHLLLLEHEPVYTLGRGARVEDLLGADRRLGVPVHRVGRGGGVTYHGPGQLVAYPILSLGGHGRDVHRYVRTLEAVTEAVFRHYGIAAATRSGLTGVWVEERKIASIGVGVRRWVSFHGVALNIAPDLAYFRAIVPCAMPEVTMTSIEIELGCAPTLDETGQVFEDCFRRTFGYPRPIPPAAEGLS